MALSASHKFIHGNLDSSKHCHRATYRCRLVVSKTTLAYLIALIYICYCLKYDNSSGSKTEKDEKIRNSKGSTNS